MRTELLELWKLLGCTVILVTHNALEAVYLADRLLIMSAGPGRIIADEDLRTRLPRPRRSDDGEIWSVARHAVGLLGRGNGGAADGTNPDRGEVSVERSG
jgi:NitT/TauT family transport system ATP-binding protein